MDDNTTQSASYKYPPRATTVDTRVPTCVLAVFTWILTHVHSFVYFAVIYSVYFTSES